MKLTNCRAALACVISVSAVSAEAETYHLNPRSNVLEIGPSNCAPMGGFSGHVTLTATGSPTYGLLPGENYRYVVLNGLDEFNRIMHVPIAINNGSTSLTVHHLNAVFLTDESGTQFDNLGSVYVEARDDFNMVVGSGTVTTNSNIALLTGSNSAHFGTTSAFGWYKIKATGSGSFGSGSAGWGSVLFGWDRSDLGVYSGIEYFGLPVGTEVWVQGRNFFALITDGEGTLGDNSGGFDVSVTPVPEPQIVLTLAAGLIGLPRFARARRGRCSLCSKSAENTP